MAKLVGVFASSHAPLMARAWEAVDAARRDAISRTFAELARRVVEAKPDGSTTTRHTIPVRFVPLTRNPH